jgi:uncharacterized membrane protein
MEKGSKDLLFDGWHDWSSYIGNALVGVVKGISRVLYAIIMGIVTLLVYAYKQIKRFVVAYPVPVLSFLCVVLLLCVLFLFTNYSAKLKTCQMERDSVAYEKMKLEQAFIGDTIVIRGHSTRKEKAELIE